MIYENIRALREQNHLTQTQLAQKLHMAQNTYSQYENGQRQLPIDILVQLALYFHTSTDYILGLTDTPVPYPPGRQSP